jgi:hypothetical protein
MYANDLTFRFLCKSEQDRQPALLDERRFTVGSLVGHECTLTI